MSTKALIQYRGEEVAVLPGHSAVLDCYKKKILGQVVVKVEDFEGDHVVAEGSVIQLAGNGDHNVAGYETARVDVKMSLQEKTVSPSESVQEITPDESNDGLSKVTVEAIQTQQKTATVNGSTVEADPGKYLSKVFVEIPAGSDAKGTREIEANGVYDVRLYAEANVNVQPALESKGIVPYEAEQIVRPSEGKYGLSEVTVAAIPIETKTITENGTHTAAQGKYFKTVTVAVPIPDGYLKPEGEWDITKNGSYNVTRYAKANINVQPTLQEKSVTPAASAQEVVSDEGVYGLSKVTVEAVPTEEVSVTEPVKEVIATPGKFISKVNVNVPTVTVYSGTSEPTNDIGADGDIYLLLEE